MFELNQLEQLLAFAKYKTLSRASEELLISQPALSRSMQRLESELDVQLFERQKNRIELNDNGKLAVECAEKIMYDVNNMLERVRAYDRSKRTISIGSCAPAPLWKLSSIISGIYPEFTVSTTLTTTEKALQGLQNCMYDLIIVPSPVDDSNILSFELCKEHLMLSVPPAHPLAMYKNVSFKDIDGETMLLFSEIGFWHDICNKYLPNTNFIMQNDAQSFASLIKVSALPAFTSDIALDSAENENRVLLPITDKEANPTFYCAVCKKDRKKYAALIENINAGH